MAALMAPPNPENLMCPICTTHKTGMCTHPGKTGWGGRRESLHGYWHERTEQLELADGTMVNREALLRDWKLTMHARYQAMGVFGSGSRREAVATMCDLCGVADMAPFSMGDGVLFCLACYKTELAEPYNRPWWLRALRWLARI